MEVGKHEEQPFLVPSERVSEEDQVDAQETPFRGVSKVSCTSYVIFPILFLLVSWLSF